MRTIGIACCAFALTAFLASPVFAQVNGTAPNSQGANSNGTRIDPDGTNRAEAPGAGLPEPYTNNVIPSGTKDMRLTFSGPVQLPRVTLPAGTYMFQMMPVANSASLGDHIIKVSSGDGRQSYGMFLTLPADKEKSDSSDARLVMFREVPEGMPQAVRVWFYQGSTAGEEFIYPKDQAVAIARANHTTVLASDANKVVRVDEYGNEPSKNPIAERASAPPTVALVARNESSQAGVGTEGAASGTPAATGQLPRTASGLPAAELLSLLFVAGAFGTRQLRRRLE